MSPGKKKTERRSARPASAEQPTPATGTTTKTPPRAPATGEAPRAAKPPLPFLTVGIGASAGGLAALEAFFSALSGDAGANMAFVVVQHLSADYKSMLAELLGRRTVLPVREIEDGMAVAPGHVYTIPPDRDLTIADGVLRLAKPAAPRGLRLPADIFFRSLAGDRKEAAVAVVLSGTGSDGTQGARAVKGEGGLVLVQNPESADHDSMPKSVIAAGVADAVLPPAEMPAQLAAYAAHRHIAPSSEEATASSEALRRIVPHVCALLLEQTGNDFSQYKGNTLCRRIERRMALHQIESPIHYLHFLKENRTETEALFHDLLIGVTNFFRDRDSFEALRGQVLPRLFAAAPESGPIRVWVCGCATGEEAYSLAILFLEEMESEKAGREVQIFATDIDSRAIQHARAGIYPASIGADLSAERLARFFVREPESGAYRVQKEVRDLIIFSLQDVTRDPPFSRVDLISCRNLLIYMTAELQKRIIPLFHYALKPEGFLFLGGSETVGEFSTLFSPLDRGHKLFRRRLTAADAPRPPLGDFLGSPGGLRHAHRPPRGKDETDLRALTEQELLAHYVQSSVLVDRRGRILYIHGRTGKFLEPAAGEAGMDILAMAREGLTRDLSMALYKAALQKETVRSKGVRVRTDGDSIGVNLTVRPLVTDHGATTARELFLVIFEEMEEDETPAAAGSGPARTTPEAERRVAALEQELMAREEYLQTTLEEMRTANEELRAANEALQSTNEELQSANEELETSREELQSVNEELATVNAELQNKVAELSRANNDMNNLLAGTGVGTLFVDTKLRVSRFTPTVTQVVNLIRTDIGRPLAHITTNLVGYDRMVEDARTVLEDLVPREAEVRTHGNVWFLMRVRPYRTLDNVVEGAVITFVDITERRKAREELRELTTRLSLAQVFVRDLDGRIVTWTRGSENLYGFSAEEAVGRVSHELLRTVFPAPMAGIEAAVLSSGRWQGDLSHTAKDGGKLVVSSVWTLYRDEDGAPRHIIESNTDVTSLKRAEAECRRLEEQLKKQ